MSVDLSQIIPNNCRSIVDPVEARKCFDDTIDSIIRYFRGHEQFVTEINIDEGFEDLDNIDYSFEIPIFNIGVYMHAGFWDVWQNARYHHYFCPCGKDLFNKPRIWARDACFNTLLAFGRTDGWICDEFHSWNSALEDYNSNFDDWKSYGETPEDRKIYEFDIMEFADVDVEHQGWPDYKDKYHDEYKECHAVLEARKRQFPDHDILSINEPLPNYTFVAKGNELYLLNNETGNSLTDFPIDNCIANFNGAGIQIFHGDESAFYNMKGKQLTDFRRGKFTWDWDTRDWNRFGQIITDHATGKRFLTDGTPIEK